ncbi:MAG: ribosylnicotinamide kinase [Phylliscum demangeonii]|nr:MAG: ribosylnicotinamide kinase [Phylliscum demangeonii]
MADHGPPPAPAPPGARARAALIVGISGCSSSGKTTLCRLLRGLFAQSMVVHQDDFYKAEDDIPRTPDGLDRDWDTVAALNMPAFVAALQYVRTHARLPPGLVSLEADDGHGHGHGHGHSGGTLATAPPVAPETMARVRSRIAASAHPRPIAFVDGFLLYGASTAPTPLPRLFDLKLFLRVPGFRTVQRRRARRAGYVVEPDAPLWRDPPGYFARVVWPAYVREHAMGNLLEWAVGIILDKLENDNDNDDNEREETK